MFVNLVHYRHTSPVHAEYVNAKNSVLHELIE